MKPIHGIRDRAERRSAVNRYKGQRVTVKYGRVRGFDEAHELEGTLVCVAHPLVGTVADLAIIDTEPGKVHPTAISLASIIAVEPVR